MVDSNEAARTWNIQIQRGDTMNGKKKVVMVPEVSFDNDFLNYMCICYLIQISNLSKAHRT